MAKFFKRQEKVLNEYLATVGRDNWPLDASDLPGDVWDKVQRINDTETLFTDVTRYIDDKRFEVIYGRR